MSEIIEFAESWGRYPKRPQRVLPRQWYDEPLPASECILPYGMGRSYGDSCLNTGGKLLSTRTMNRFVHFDDASGVLICESGVTLEELIEQCLPRGWFPPVSPGTRYVTIGGAVANDVHGKNHHVAGSFGNHVLWFELQRSNGDRLICSPDENTDFFYATIGGLGLTGLITHVALQLLPVTSSFMEVENIRFDNLQDFKRLSDLSVDTHDYTVAWVDCMSKGSRLGRGIFMRANHAKDVGEIGKTVFGNKGRMSVPFEFPNFVLNKFTISNFNRLYFYKQWRARSFNKQHISGYFYPLDAISHWNLIYGRTGFLQYQFVIPVEQYSVLSDVLKMISDAAAGSFLAVLKEFGKIKSLGMLSFPREGVCLALDFPNKGKATFDLLNRLDSLVIEVGGAVYPAKDARMSSTMFYKSFPKAEEFSQYIDNQFSSDFWARITEGNE